MVINKERHLNISDFIMAEYELREAEEKLSDTDVWHVSEELFIEFQKLDLLFFDKGQPKVFNLNVVVNQDWEGIKCELLEEDKNV